MYGVTTADPVSRSASKKKKKSKKKANGKGMGTASDAITNGATNDVGDAAGGEEGGDEDDDAPIVNSIPTHVHVEDTLHMPSSPPLAPSSPIEREPKSQSNHAAPQPHEERHALETDEQAAPSAAPNDDNVHQSPPDAQPRDTSARLDALQQDRDRLRDEVTQWRQKLQALQQQHDAELAAVKTELEQSNSGKEHAETQYRSLLGKVNTIRSQLGDRLKQDAEELEQARERIEALEASDKAAAEENERLQERVTALAQQADEQRAEIDSLRTRSNLSASNWAKERDDLISREAYMREEYEVAKQAMQDWEVLATEELSRREALEERVGDLEDQVATARDAYERVKAEADTQSNTVDGLQRALRDLQDERKRELRETVEQSQAQLDALQQRAKSAEDAAAALKPRLDEAQAALARALPFEKEVKEKNLLIGKLRHEAVILNDHLTKALRFLKRGRPEDNVDRQLVTNHLLHFLALDRSDPKKFQVLQLIAALLGWDELQREQAGLLRQGAGASAASLRLPVSPFRRTPSTPALSSDFVPDPPSGGGGGGGGGRESLAELWSEFLAREAESGGERRGSASTVRSLGLRSPSAASQISPWPAHAGRESSPDMRRKESQSEGGGKGAGPA